jgi:hypothetical protein
VLPPLDLRGPPRGDVSAVTVFPMLRVKWVKGRFRTFEVVHAFGFEVVDQGDLPKRRKRRRVPLMRGQTFEYDGHVLRVEGHEPLVTCALRAAVGLWIAPRVPADRAERAARVAAENGPQTSDSVELLRELREHGD